MTFLKSHVFKQRIGDDNGGAHFGKQYVEPAASATAVLSGGWVLHVHFGLVLAGDQRYPVKEINILKGRFRTMRTFLSPSEAAAATFASIRE